MNLFVSIFGGMLLTVILFGVMRAFKLSNFWAAVIAAGLPSFAYVIYAVSEWPGLDVLTMHIVAYPTVALLLFQTGGMKTGDTQKEHWAKVHWAPKLMIGFFVMLTIVLGTFVYIAGNGLPPAVAQWLLPDIKGKTVYTGFAGVVAHGGEASKSISHHRNMESKLAKLGWHVEVSGLDALRFNAAGEVRVDIRDRLGNSVPNVQVGLLLGRPGETEPTRLEFAESQQGGYLAQVLLPLPGEWLAALTLAGAGELIIIEHVLGGE